MCLYLFKLPGSERWKTYEHKEKTADTHLAYRFQNRLTIMVLNVSFSQTHFWNVVFFKMEMGTESPSQFRVNSETGAKGPFSTFYSSSASVSASSSSVTWLV